MKKRSMITIGLAAAFILAAMAVLVYGGKPKGEMLEYEVISIEAKGWVVTARETATGNVVKFRLPPAVFKGKTFDFNMQTLQPGQRFSVRGPRNTQLDQLIVKQPLKSMAAGPSPEGGKPGMAETPMITPPGEPPMPWEILHVDPRKWIVTARNRLTHQTVKFQVHPETFNGFRFRANLRGINQGQGFSIVTPNDLPMKDSCTLLKIMK